MIGFVETHGRAHTAAMLGDLEHGAPPHVDYRGAEFTEMDLDAVLARRPEVALVDELAHTNVPGSRHDKRWQDVEELLDAGIDVLSPRSTSSTWSRLNDVVEQITGTTAAGDRARRGRPRRRAGRAGRHDPARRCAGGWRTATSTRPRRVDAALGNYFRVGNLTALRELALLWLADKVDEQLDRYRASTASPPPGRPANGSSSR